MADTRSTWPPVTPYTEDQLTDFSLSQIMERFEAMAASGAMSPEIEELWSYARRFIATIRADRLKFSVDEATASELAMENAELRTTLTAIGNWCEHYAAVAPLGDARQCLFGTVDAARSVVKERGTAMPP